MEVSHTTLYTKGRNNWTRPRYLNIVLVLKYQHVNLKKKYMYIQCKEICKTYQKVFYTQFREDTSKLSFKISVYFYIRILSNIKIQYKH